MKITHLDDALIKVDARMRKVNLEACRTAGWVNGNTVELDSLLNNSMRVSFAHTNLKTKWINIFFGLQLLVDIIFIWRMFK